MARTSTKPSLITNDPKMPKPNRNGKARRLLTEVSDQELELMEKEYVTDQNINLKYLCQKYNVYEKQLGFYAKRKWWVQKRSKHFKPIQAIEFKPLAQNKARVMGLAVVEETQAIKSQADIDHETYLEAKSKSRSLTLQTLRERLTLALHCTQADIDAYIEDPERLIREMETLAIDEKAVKNYKMLIDSLEQVIKLERIEDGLSNNPKDRTDTKDIPSGRLIVLTGEDNDAEDLGHMILEGETIDQVLT